MELETTRRGHQHTNMFKVVLLTVAVVTVANAFTAQRPLRALSTNSRRSLTLHARGRYDDEEDWFDDDIEDERRGGGPRFENKDGRKRRRDSGTVSGGGWSTLIPQKFTTSLLAGIFVLGVGTGVTVDSAINTNPKDLASRDAIDRAVPNSDLCQQYGASAMVMDQRVFVSFNPFNVYVTQADTKPGCVLRPSNVVPVLQDKGLLEKSEIAACKNNMNTWAFVGDLNDKPQLSCVYKSQDAQNEFLSDPKLGVGEDVYDNDPSYTKRDPSYAKRVKQ